MKYISPIMIPTRRSLLSAFSLLLSAFFLTGCFSDETTLGDPSILSEITIDASSIDSVYNILGNESLTITPRITQHGAQKSVTYEWEVNQQVVSHEEVFHYEADELGTFPCRLIVGNADGKTFYPFTINVNTAYEEGLTVLSTAPDGSSHLSFMLTPTDGSEPHFYPEECFSRNNPDIPFAKNAVDMIHTENSLYIMCQGSEQESPAIYNMHHKTLKMKNYICVNQYSDFRPTLFALPAKPYPGNHYPILCENGQTYDFGSENVVGLPTKLKANYAQKILMFDSRFSNYYYNIFWDKDANALGMLYTGYGPFYCSKTYLCSRDSVMQNPTQYNYFKDEEFVTMTRTHVTTDKQNSQDPEIIVITRRSVGPLTTLKRTVLNYNFWVYNDEGENVLSVSAPIKNCATIAPGQSIPLDISTPMTASKLYNSIFYGNGNKLKRWNYISDDITKSTLLATIGSEKAVIKGVLLSDDQQSLYVSFYEPDESGLNGSIWVIDTDKGTILHRYDNVCYNPVKMIYKAK